MRTPAPIFGGSLVTAKLAAEGVTLSTAYQFAPETLKRLGSPGLAPKAAPALPTRAGKDRLREAEQKEPVELRP